MDLDAVVAKALLLGCRLEHVSGAKHYKRLVTPSGKFYPLPAAANGRDHTDGPYRAIKFLRENGVDVKRGRAAGPVKRVDGDKLLCRETRCANLLCPRNQLALETLPASGKAFAHFRSKACGFIQLSGCGVVIRRGDEPQICALPSKHEGRCEPAPPIPKVEEAPMLQLAAEAAAASAGGGDEKKRQIKKKVFCTPEQQQWAIARAKKGDKHRDIAADLNVSPSVISNWCKADAEGRLPASRGKADPATANVQAPAPRAIPVETEVPVAKPNGVHPEPQPVQVPPAYALPAPAPQTLFAVDPPMLAVVQVGSETYDLAIPASELVKLVLKYRVSQ